MNKLTLTAALLSALITAAHIFGGGPQYHEPVLASTWDAENKAIYSILWHFASLIMAINTVALLSAALKHPAPAVINLVALQSLAFAALFIFYGWQRLDTITLLPQWTVFLLIAALAFWGAHRAQQPSSAA